MLFPRPEKTATACHWILGADATGEDLPPE